MKPAVCSWSADLCRIICTLIFTFALWTIFQGVAVAGVDLVGQLDERQEYQDVWGYDAPDGTALALVGTQNGDMFVDVTDPTAPVEIAFVEDPDCNWRDIKTRGNYAYAVKDCTSDDCLRIYDLTEPLAPRLVYSSSEFFRRSHNIYIDGDRLYSTGTFRGLVVLDISDPVNPRELGVFEEPYLHDIYVRDGIGYGAAFFAQELILLDVSDPANISVLSDRPYPGAATHNTWLTGDGQHCVTTDEVADGHLRVFNVADPLAPFLVSEFTNPRDPGSSVHNVQILNELAYTSWYTSGLFIVSLQTPGLPQEVGAFDTSMATGLFDGAWGAYPYTASGLIYVSDRQEGLHILRYTPTHADWTLSVNRADTGSPISGAEVVFAEDNLETVTTAGLTSTLLLQPGEHHFEITLFGFETAFGTVNVVNEEAGQLSVDLVPLPAGRVAGTVEATGANLEQALVSILDTPLELRPDANGRFEFPEVPIGVYTVRTELFGFGRRETEIEIMAGGESLILPQLESALFAEDFEAETAWTVGSPTDDAISGIWIRVNPNRSGRSDPVQPEDDASSFGEFAFVTGNAEPGADVGTDDVDEGVTTLFSPILDLSGAETPVLQFWRWFVTSEGTDTGDFLEVSASTNGGQSWVRLSRVDSSEGVWTRVEISLRKLLGDLTAVQLRFVAGDEGTPSLVEAAIDDVEVFDGGGTVPGNGTLPETARIESPRPHPMNGESDLRFRMPVSTTVRLDLFDVAGRRVRSLGEFRLPAGDSGRPFDGRGDEGEPLASGVYLLRMVAPDGSSSRVVHIVQ